MGVFAGILSLFLSSQGDPGHDGAPGAVGEKVSGERLMLSRGVFSLKGTLRRDRAWGKRGAGHGEQVWALRGPWGKPLCC